MTRNLLATAALGAVLWAAPAGAETTLQLVEVITSPQRTEHLRGMIARFEEANPDIKVDVTSLPWGQAFEKLATMVQGGQAPDVVEMPDRWMALYVNTGQLVDLEPYMGQWPQAAKLTDRTREFGSVVQGQTHMIPYGFYLRAMFYNKKLLTEAGIDSPPSTLEEFRAAAEAVSKLAGKYGYCLRGGPGGLNGWMMFGATNNGDGAF